MYRVVDSRLGLLQPTQHMQGKVKWCLHSSRKQVAVMVLRPLAGPDLMAATMTGMGRK